MRRWEVVSITGILAATSFAVGYGLGFKSPDKPPTHCESIDASHPDCPCRTYPLSYTCRPDQTAQLGPDGVTTLCVCKE